jgi:ElaB/YqjD/DUF883 family membrane-anchored ribosome-binding protein
MKNKIDETHENEQLQALKHTMTEWAHSFNDKLGKLGQEVKKYSGKGTEAATQVVEEHPLKSVGIALACGLVVGFLMGRSK